MRLKGGALALAMCWCGIGAAAEEVDVDALFGGSGKADDGGVSVGGYAEFGGAYTLPSPGHWSRLRARGELTAAGRGAGLKWKLTGRAEADGAYDLEREHYTGAVRRDQRTDFALREAYIDHSFGDWELRLGRQHVIWGEMVGFFFADVVSARDMREFLLPEFEAMRIAQWAGRAEYFAGDSHFELLWVPVAGYDRIGKPGSDFYPFPLPSGMHVSEKKPDAAIDNGNWGLRLSHLIGGWDLSLFYYSSQDVTPTLYRVSSAPAEFELRHDRIRQAGGTFSKDLGDFVVKGEFVHTRGRRFNTEAAAAAYGLVESDTLDYALGVDVPVGDRWRFNTQYFERIQYDHRPGMLTDRAERGMTFQAVRKFGDALEFELLAAWSLNREDYMVRPKLTWQFAPAWRAVFGYDHFEGRDAALFGRFDDSDRAYAEVRRWF